MLTTTATELSRLMLCMGSRNMRSPLPQGGNVDDRTEGNAAHWLAEQSDPAACVGKPCPKNGHIITEDMLEHVMTYLDALDPDGAMEVETSWTGASYEVRGRADHVCFDPLATRPVDRTGSAAMAYSLLTVDDFKYGWGIVEPARNWTLLSHAIGWCIRNNTRPDVIRLRIHQPRPYHADGPTREWTCSYDELMGFYSQIDAQLSNPVDTLNSGLEQCAKCHARYDCPAFDRATYNAIDVSLEPFDDTKPNSVMAQEYALFQRAEKMLKIAREAREELMTHRIKEGQTFTGFALEKRLGQRKFKPGLTGKALSAALGVDLVKDGLVTPAEAERRGVPEEVIAALVDRPTLPSKLKSIDVDAKARAAFGNK